MSRRSAVDFDIVYNLWQERNGLCFYCDKFTYLRKGKNKYYNTNSFPETIKEKASCDHIIPISRGGKNHYSNMVLSCVDCNNIKGDCTGEEFLRIKYDWGCDYKKVTQYEQDARQRQRNQEFIQKQKAAANRLLSRRIQSIYNLFKETT